MTTTMTMKRITAGFVSLALVCTMGLAPIQDNGEVSGFLYAKSREEVSQGL